VTTAEVRFGFPEELSTSWPSSPRLDNDGLQFLPDMFLDGEAQTAIGQSQIHRPTSLAWRRNETLYNLHNLRDLERQVTRSLT
jgi:hypothetical protein